MAELTYKVGGVMSVGDAVKGTVYNRPGVILGVIVKIAAEWPSPDHPGVMVPNPTHNCQVRVLVRRYNGETFLEDVVDHSEAGKLERILTADEGGPLPKELPSTETPPSVLLTSKGEAADAEREGTARDAGRGAERQEQHGEDAEDEWDEREVDTPAGPARQKVRKKK